MVLVAGAADSAEPAFPSHASPRSLSEAAGSSRGSRIREGPLQETVRPRPRLPLRRGLNGQPTLRRAHARTPRPRGSVPAKRLPKANDTIHKVYSPTEEMCTLLWVQEESEFMSVREAARFLNVHENTVRNWAKQGTLAPHRMPGSRFQRFAREEVERLSRGAPSADDVLVRERIRTGPDLVNATSLAAWAERKSAPHLFPELIRRLLAATPGCSTISVPAHEGTSGPGWDGRATSAGSAFLPAGELRFELGVSAEVKRKADTDLQKRKAELSGEEASALTYVYATPRRWARGRAWADARSQDSGFAGVRVLDADDLEGWLATVPAVHYWLSEQLDRRPEDASTVERWWSDFSQRTTPPLPRALFLAGREVELTRFQQLIAAKQPAITIRAPWAEDALAFVAAALKRSPEDPVALVVHSGRALEQILESPPTLLIPRFDNPAVGHATAREHQMVLIADADHVVQQADISLPPLGRPEATEVLREHDFDFDDAHELAGLGRRSMPALVRRMARDPMWAKPLWSRGDNAEILAPLALIGGWAATEVDCRAVAQAIGHDWRTIEARLRRWAGTADPPFVESGGQWRAAAAEETFSVLRDSLTIADLSAWRAFAEETLTAVDPRVLMSIDERSMAGLRDDLPPRPSSTLKAALARNLALLGALDDVTLADGATARTHAVRVVRTVMQHASDDDTAAVWRTLNDSLPRLAEAAPKVFLEHVLDDLESPQPKLALLFEDVTSAGGLFGVHSSHTGLLWALEVLAWSPDWIHEACDALALLCKLDPGGRLSNRPSKSLREILIGWVPHTSASRETVNEVISGICERHPDVGWPLLLALWPETHGIGHPPARPAFQDWSPRTRHVTIGEHLLHVKVLVAQALKLAGTSATRWRQLIGKVYELPDELAHDVLDVLTRHVAAGWFNQDERLALYSDARTELARHERFSSAPWTMKGELLSRFQALVASLEPAQRPERLAYLFDWHPDLDGSQPDIEDHDAYENQVSELQRQALREALADGGLPAVEKIAVDAPLPRKVGHVLADVATMPTTEPALVSLLSGSGPGAELAFGWLARRLELEGPASLSACAAVIDPDDEAARRKLADAIPGTDDFIAAISAFEDLDASFWEQVHQYRLRTEDIKGAADRFAAANRPWAALEFVMMKLKRDADEQDIDTALIVGLLDQVLDSDGEDSSLQSAGYEIDRILAELRARDVDVQVLAKYEIAFFPLLEHHYSTPALWTVLETEPSLFIDAVCHVYRGKSEQPRKPAPTEQRSAELSWSVLHSWRRLPGLRPDGTIDADHLERWVDEARLDLSARDRADIGDQEIGRVLAASPIGSDGVWPAEPVRDIIDRIGSREIEIGFQVGVSNDRGVTTRGVYDGGKLERAEAAKYRTWAAATRGTWRRTSRALHELAEGYEADALREDAQARARGDAP